MEPSSTGILLDMRTPAGKEFDVKDTEIYGTIPTPPYLTSLKAASNYVNRFPLDDQYQTSSCVAHRCTLCMGIKSYLKNGTFIKSSDAFIYRLRANYPAPGMVPVDADNITENSGSCIYADLPTPEAEADLDAVVITPLLKKIALNNRIDIWVSITNYNQIDPIAFATNVLRLPVSFLFFSTIDEWSKLEPTIDNNDLTLAQATVRHNVTILPNSAYIDPVDNVKKVIIQDSTPFGGIYFRHVTEAFIKARCYGAEYPSDTSFKISSRPAVGQFEKDMQFGNSSSDVLALQTFLQYLGYMPNVVNGFPFSPTTYYGGMTMRAVEFFQSENGIPHTGYCGPETRAALNAMIPSSGIVQQ